MSHTIQGVVLFVIALLPGSLFVWGFERNAGRYGVGLGDRSLRFVGVSAIFIAAFSPALYWLYATYWVSFVSREPLPTALWAAPVCYLAVPGATGWLLGYANLKRWAWAERLVGFRRVPSSWDFLFERNEAGWVRCRLTDGQWLVGLYATVDGRQPHASTYPNDKDLYLPRMVGVDQSTGRIHTDDQGNPIYAGGGVLIRWSEIKYLEFVQHDAGESQRAQ